MAKAESQILPIDYLNSENIRYLFRVSNGSQNFLVGMREYDESYSCLELVETVNGKGMIVFSDAYHHLRATEVTRANAAELADYLFKNISFSRPEQDETVFTSVHNNSNIKEAKEYAEKHWFPVRREHESKFPSFLLKAAAIVTIGFVLDLGITAMAMVTTMAIVRIIERRKRPRVRNL